MKNAVFTPTKIKKKVFMTLLPEFLKEVEGDFNNLQYYYSQSDLIEVGNSAHKIKGTSKGYGAQLIVDSAYQLELAARGRQPENETPTHFSEMIQMLQKNIELTKQYAQKKYKISA